MKYLRPGRLLEMRSFCSGRERQREGVVTTGHLRGPRTRGLLREGGHGNKRGRRCCFAGLTGLPRMVLVSRRGMTGIRAHPDRPRTA